MSIENDLNNALAKAQKAIMDCPPHDTRLRERLQAEAELISATFGIITGDDPDESRREWVEASYDFA